MPSAARTRLAGREAMPASQSQRGHDGSLGEADRPTPDAPRPGDDRLADSQSGRPPRPGQRPASRRETISLIQIGANGEVQFGGVG